MTEAKLLYKLARAAKGQPDLGFAPALRLRAGSRTKVLILSQDRGDRIRTRSPRLTIRWLQ